MSVVIEQGQKTGEIKADIPPIGSRAVPAEFSVRCDLSIQNRDNRPPNEVVSAFGI
jgi:hypothetical protein